jgi:Fur family ferric uptake transcriptional regulator
MENALVCLKDHACKLTQARRSVLEVLFKEEKHLTSSEIIELVAEGNSKIGRASIFRALELFTDLGIIRPSNFEGQSPRYVVMEANGHHAHLVCNRCKQVIDLGDCRLEGILEQVAKENQFKLSGHLLELYGMCKTCAPHASDLETK